MWWKRSLLPATPFFTNQCWALYRLRLTQPMISTMPLSSQQPSPSPSDHGGTAAADSTQHQQRQRQGSPSISRPGRTEFRFICLTHHLVSHPDPTDRPGEGKAGGGNEFLRKSPSGPTTSPPVPLFPLSSSRGVPVLLHHLLLLIDAVATLLVSLRRHPSPAIHPPPAPPAQKDPTCLTCCRARAVGYMATCKYVCALRSKVQAQNQTRLD